MSSLNPLTMQRVVSQISTVGAFPDVVQFLIGILADPNANVRALVERVEKHPAIASRLLAVANNAVRARGGSEVRDLQVAASLLGLRRVRELVLLSSVVSYVQLIAAPVVFAEFWSCSVACAVCSVEVAQSSGLDVSVELCLIAGLLHNMGQIWLHRFEFSTYEQARRYATANRISRGAAQRHLLGVDACEISGWLAMHWGLGAAVTRAISFSEFGPNRKDDLIGDAVHLGYVLGNSLDLAATRNAQVRSIAVASCTNLGVDWSQDSHQLFGRIEARYKDAMALTLPNPAKADWT